MTDSQELDKFISKLLPDVQAQLDLYVTMGMKFSSVEHVCKLIGMMERANGGSQKKNFVNAVNWRKKKNHHPFKQRRAKLEPMKCKRLLVLLLCSLR